MLECCMTAKCLRQLLVPSWRLMYKKNFGQITSEMFVFLLYADQN
jgi:hypothetical protein